MIPVAWTLVGLAALCTLLGHAGGGDAAYGAGFLFALGAGGLAIAAPREAEPGSRRDAWNRNHARPMGGRR